MKNFQNKTKIVKVSEAMRIILLCGLVVWGFTIGACIVPLIEVVPGMKHVSPIQWYVFGGVVLQPVLGFIANLKLVQFFNRLKNGFLFDAVTVGCLSATGKWWFAYWIYQTIFLGGRTLFFGVAMNWDLACLFGSLTLIFVAWFFREAQELQEEQELTV
jgi:hypothetical protein